MALHRRMLLLQLSLAAVLLATTMLAAALAPPPDCNESCGGVSVPYPFGLSDGCYLHVPGQDSQQPFKITCDTTTSQPSLQFSDSDNFPTNIANIFVEESALQVTMAPSYFCNKNIPPFKVRNLTLPPSYTLSDRNKVFIVGCNKITRFTGFPLQVTDPEQLYEVGFSGTSLCQGKLSKGFPDNCTGFGCSVNSIPSGLKNITMEVWPLSTGSGLTRQWDWSYPCGYGFVVDERNFTFDGQKSFAALTSGAKKLPVLANWAIGNDNCEAAKKKKETAFACNTLNSKCVDRASGGYFCQCEDGYEGNPYLLGNCTVLTSM